MKGNKYNNELRCSAHVRINRLRIVGVTLIYVVCFTLYVLSVILVEPFYSDKYP